MNPDKTVLEEKEKQDTLLKIPGIMLSDVKVRTYYLKEAASHLVGYVQAVTAEDLQEHKGEGYRTNSVIGKTGLETLIEHGINCNLEWNQGNHFREPDIRIAKAFAWVMEGK